MSEQHTPESVLELAHGTYSMRDYLANQFLFLQEENASIRRINDGLTEQVASLRAELNRVALAKKHAIQERDALVDALGECMNWMETLRLSGDAGFWEWVGECEYTKAEKLIARIKAGQP